MDLSAQRENMVKAQLISRKISDQRVLDAFAKVPREEFVPAELRDSAYDDSALPIGQDQTISQPYMVAVMTEKMKLLGSETVLEIGTGSGYQVAILAELAKKVYTIERFEALSRQAEATVRKLGYSNANFVIGDGTEGHVDAAPYDAIVVTAGCPKIPQPLIDQLKDGGRLVLPLGTSWQQVLTTVTKHGSKLNTEGSVPCVFVPLIGKFGWQPH